MIQRVIFRPAAFEDVVEATTWYEARSPGLGEDLIDEILRAIRRAGANPDLFRIIREEGQVRRVLTDRFPLPHLLLRPEFNALCSPRFSTPPSMIVAGKGG